MTITARVAPGRGWLVRRTLRIDLIVAVTTALLACAPLAYLVLRALQGGESALAALFHPRTLELLARSVLLATVVALTSIGWALPLAWLTERTTIPGRQLVAIVLSLPLAVPSYLVAYAVVAAFGPRGALATQLERWLGLERLPELYGFWGAWLTLSLVTFPYSYLAVRGALARLDPGFEEAARTLGLTSRERFWRVTVPLLGPALAAGFLLSALYTLSDFGAIAILRYPTLTYSIYNQYRLSFDRSAAAALALLLVVLATLLLIGERYWQRRIVLYRSSGTTRVPPRHRPGPWGWCLLVAGSAWALLGVALPFGVALYWLGRARAVGETVPSIGEPLRHSLLVGAAAALVTVALAFPIARVTVRETHRMLGRFLDLPLWISYGLPGIVLALALVSPSAQLLPWLYQTIPLLLLGYALRFLPEATGSLRAVLALQSPRLEDAARTLGSGPLATWFRIHLPLSLPGLASAAALVFLTTIKELPVTLLLSPIGFTTLATAVWNATADAYWSHAALPTLALLVVGVLPSALISWRLDREGTRGGAGG